MDGRFNYREGPGEAFADGSGNWHCSQTCLELCGREKVGGLPLLPILLLLLLGMLLFLAHFLILRATMGR